MYCFINTNHQITNVIGRSIDHANSRFFSAQFREEEYFAVSILLCVRPPSIPCSVLSLVFPPTADYFRLFCSISTILNAI